MQMYDLIYKKRNGRELTREEINYFIQGYTAGTIPDYQVSALLMAIYFKGMTGRETADLTMAMVNSGEVINLEQIPGIKVDKHSTGGVGDKTTLVLAPLVASAGVPVAKMSGRGLGHTGGTIDKLESIPGFNVNLQPEDFIRQVKDIGIALMAQTGIITPADKKLYALRDVTATVDSIPLIASSVTSKKIASGADAILLDVKCGSGAFMKTRQDAASLAQAMVAIGKLVNRRMVAVVTEMGQPLGRAVGNALEVKEALTTLVGEGPGDLRELCLTLGSHMLVLGGVSRDTAGARARLKDLLNQGKALQKFKQLIEAQGGNASVIDSPEKLPAARYQSSVAAPEGGYVADIDTMQVGRAAMLLGAGRASKDDLIDHAAGLVLTKKTGDFVKKGEELAVLHTNRKDALDAITKLTASAFTITVNSPEKAQLIWETIE
ncbi:pyrimidine-nucleoside phosphorylase [Desulfotomaculum arcticum]|uniref:Pyrimidine-nucleoside phosphorylase n=1 Tax=Desulfotruncus arcticus DSM 17038 TaxID=1121424 RepID=A0A1I2MRV0_9FIRM|nr:pyrimidine-nucleoside phosphorylase [Desulfotruncus arcticus]SFF94224.1 pyrimidine-nucleoside phosphorylase [Desulfotomaculum arcticum] [Desulfotruncus arcticus DSM 17038]